jgi:hypothetical protein
MANKNNSNNPIEFNEQDAFVSANDTQYSNPGLRKKFSFKLEYFWYCSPNSSTSIYQNVPLTFRLFKELFYYAILYKSYSNEVSGHINFFSGLSII